MNNIRRYPISAKNSTVNGYPGRQYDWSKFCWDGIVGPSPYTDGFLIAPACQYLHVPYDYERLGTVYSVRPNDSMYTGRTYRGTLVAKQTAELVDGVWCWVLYAEQPALTTNL